MNVADRHKEAIAGFSAGFFTTLITHPLDVIKLRLQLDTSNRSQWSSFTEICRQLVNSSKRNQRFSTFQFIHNVYRGLSPNLIGSTSAWAMYFFFYRSYKNLMLNYSQLDNDWHLKSHHYLISAFMAGWTTSIITNPIWVIKTRMISTNHNTPGAYTSMINGIYKIYSSDGLLGFYKGLTPALFNVAQGAVQLSLYDLIKRYMTKENPDSGNVSLSNSQYLFASASSKMVSTCIFYPLQVIRSRLQSFNQRSSANIKGQNKLVSFKNTLIVDMYTKEGVRAFYKGLGANLVRVMPATCATFLIYEKAKQIL